MTKEQKQSLFLSILSVSCITGIIIYALHQKVDGIALASAIAAIASIVGFKIGKILK